MQPQAGTDLEASLTSARKSNGEIILSSPHCLRTFTPSRDGVRKLWPCGCGVGAVILRHVKRGGIGITTLMVMNSRSWRRKPDQQSGVCGRTRIRSRRGSGDGFTVTTENLHVKTSWRKSAYELSSRAQKLAAVPEATFEEKLAGASDFPPLAALLLWPSSSTSNCRPQPHTSQRAR